MNYRDVIGLLGLILVTYLTIQHVWNYTRLPQNPAELTTSEAAQLVMSGERPLVSLVDARWDCANIYVRRGRSRWATDIALNTMSDSPQIVAHFWSKENCQSVQSKSISGVLEPIKGGEFSSLRHNGFDFGTIVKAQNVLHLCVSCNKDYYRRQMPIFLLCLIAVVAVNFNTVRKLIKSQYESQSRDSEW